MTELEFKALAVQGYNRIPLIAETFADLDTPLSLYLKLARSQASSANSYLLESVVGGERFGRYSFIGLASPVRVRVMWPAGNNPRKPPVSPSNTRMVKYVSSGRRRPGTPVSVLRPNEPIPGSAAAMMR